MLGKPCNFDKTFNCFKWEECNYSSQIDCLKQNIILLAREVEQLKHRQMQKHSLASVKWRNQAFYYKKRSKQLELYLTNMGKELPSSKELADVTQNKSVLKRKEVKRGRVRNNDKEKGNGQRPTLRPSQDGEGSNNDSKDSVHETPTG